MEAIFTPLHRGGDGTPMVCVHGFTDTWRTWELVLPVLESRHDVLAVTLPGHAGGPPLNGDLDHDTLPNALEEAMDRAGFDTAHIVGNSLGGYLALRLAARGRARTVVALAPAGGWEQDDNSFRETLRFFTIMNQLVRTAAPHADQIASTEEGRRRATESVTTNFKHIPPELVAHQIRGAAGCGGVLPMIEFAAEHGYVLDAERVTCPVRMVWGTDDKLLPWPATAVAFREQLPNADWVTLDGVGHCPQLDVPTEAAQLIVGFTAD
jgi:pimeloyl-ACP methyl ester carboxylesterase